MSPSAVKDAGPRPAPKTRIPIELDESPLYVAPRVRIFEFRAKPSLARTVGLAIVGAGAFFIIWQMAHFFTSEVSQKFFPSPVQVLAALYALFAEKNFLVDVLKSCYRVFASFFLAALVAVPVGLLMGSFKSVRALLGPVVSAWRYLPAASFIPLLLVWFGPNDTSKLALLFLGVIFF